MNSDKAVTAKAVLANAVFIDEINSGAPLFYETFSCNGSFITETLEAAEDRCRQNFSGEVNPRTIIEERGGIHYINQALLLRGGLNDQELNADFKKLVDSIIG